MDGAENAQALVATARELVSPGRGILAADESTGTIGKRFASLGIESTEETRRAYREMLLTADGLGEHVSGVILYDETIHQSARDGTPFVEVLRGADIVPGIKVDTGAKPLAGFPGETVTEGLDGLRDRLAGYREIGARFAKWRAVISIGEGIPTPTCIEANAEALARYAALCQEAGLVPIVEPETLMDGSHDIERHGRVTETVLRELFDRLGAHRVFLPGLLLKTNMVLSGKDAAVQAGADEVAERTLAVLAATVPPAVPGIVFLSGGQGDEDSTIHLDRMNRIGGAAWELSFSYGRALQAPALRTWKGEEANVPAAQSALLLRARCNGAARSGAYTPDMENAAA